MAGKKRVSAFNFEIVQSYMKTIINKPVKYKSKVARHVIQVFVKSLRNVAGSLFYPVKFTKQYIRTMFSVEQKINIRKVGYF